jgi:hypothetical protein
MKKNSFLWVALSMTAALVMTACSNDDNANESPVQQNAAKTIPYTVTVNGGEGGATTRATVADDPSDATNYHKTLYFADGDKLYVTGTNIKGVLDIQSGTGSASATFSGDLTYSGSGTPASNLSLTATLVSAQQTVGTEVSVDAAGAVTVNYPTSYCADVATAVQKYSNLTGTSDYSSKSFTLNQQTAFLNFEITFADGTTSGTELSAVVKNGATDLCTANVTTVTDNGVKAKFVLPVASGTALSGATVKMGDKAALTINNATLDGKVYNVKKTQAPAISFNKVDWSVAENAPANFISVSQTDAKAAADAEKTRANAPGYVCIYALEGGSYKWFDSHGRSGQGSSIDVDIVNDAWDEIYECDEAGDSNSIWFTVSQ